jgi:uncharacterized protein YheU (UPF0270 family)
MIQKYVKLVHEIDSLEYVPSYLPPDKLMKPFESLEALFSKEKIEKLSAQLHLMLDYGLSNASLTEQADSITEVAEEDEAVMLFDKFRRIIELVYSIYMLNKTKTITLEEIR